MSKAIQKADTERPTTFWTIRDISGDIKYLEKHALQPPVEPISSCTTCRTSARYQSIELAADHLRQKHFQYGTVSIPSHDDTPVDVLIHWINRFNLLSDQRRCAEQMKVVEACSEQLGAILTEIEEIQGGVKAGNNAHQLRYRLPKALVEGFQELVMFFVYASYVLRLIDSDSKKSDPRGLPPLGRRDFAESANAKHKLDLIGSDAEDAIEKGKLDLMLMIRTQDFTRSVNYQAVGPEYVLALVLSNLQRGVDCNDLDEIYKSYIERLVMTNSPYGLSFCAASKPHYIY
jgi:hypothetical protein